MTDAALWRCDGQKSRADAQGKGWDYISNDINEGRGHDYLYVVWKVTRI